MWVTISIKEIGFVITVHPLIRNTTILDWSDNVNIVVVWENIITTVIGFVMTIISWQQGGWVAVDTNLTIECKQWLRENYTKYKYWRCRYLVGVFLIVRDTTSLVNCNRNYLYHVGVSFGNCRRKGKSGNKTAIVTGKQIGRAHV